MRYMQHLKLLRKEDELLDKWYWSHWVVIWEEISLGPELALYARVHSKGSQFRSKKIKS